MAPGERGGVAGAARTPWPGPPQAGAAPDAPGAGAQAEAPGETTSPIPAVTAEPAAQADDEPEGFRLLAAPAAPRREARHAAPRPVPPAADLPAADAPAEAPADGPEATGWYQPTVASAMPYEFPSTGSVRLIPRPGGGTGTRAAAAGTSAASGTTAGPAAAGAGRQPGRPRPADHDRAGHDRAGHGQERGRRRRRFIRAAGTGQVTGRARDRRFPLGAGQFPPGTARFPSARSEAARAATDRFVSERVVLLPAANSDPAAAERAAPASTASRAGTSAPVVPRLAGGDLFGRHTRSYAAEHSGQQVTILQAGCTTAEDLGVDALRRAGAQLNVSMIDEDSEVTRAAVACHQDMTEATLGDLRTVPLSPRAYDIVQCSALLDRIEHAELVLDRLSAAVKPGGLLLLRIRDRDSAAGFLDRALPAVARRMIWRKLQPGEPGPHTAVYERLASGRGVQAYVTMHGLVIAERGALGGLAGGLRRGPHGYLTAQKLVARLSRGRLTAAHGDLLYVIRKPEDRFARII